MAIDDDDERSNVVDPDEFGVEIGWRRNGVAQTPFNAVFNRPSITFRDDDTAPATDRKAWLVCRESDLPAGAGEADPVSVDGETISYLCARILPDGQGFCVVELKAAGS